MVAKLVITNKSPVRRLVVEFVRLTRVIAAKEYASAGFKLKSAFDQTVSVGSAWSKPSDETLRDEYVVEASYIYQLSKNHFL